MCTMRIYRDTLKQVPTFRSSQVPKFRELQVPNFQVPGTSSSEIPKLVNNILKQYLQKSFLSEKQFGTQY